MVFSVSAVKNATSESKLDEAPCNIYELLYIKHHRLCIPLVNSPPAHRDTGVRNSLRIYSATSNKNVRSRGLICGEKMYLGRFSHQAARNAITSNSVCVQSPPTSTRLTSIFERHTFYRLAGYSRSKDLRACTAILSTQLFRTTHPPSTKLILRVCSDTFNGIGIRRCEGQSNWSMRNCCPHI